MTSTSSVSQRCVFFLTGEIHKLKQLHSGQARVHSRCSHLGYLYVSSLLYDSCLANLMSGLLSWSEVYPSQASLAEPVKSVCGDQETWSQGQPCQCCFELFCASVALFVSQRGVVGKEWQIVDTLKLLVHNLSIQFSHVDESELKVNPKS